MTNETRGLDYSYARPSPAEIKSRGYEFVLRYIAFGSPSKLLTKAEASALRKAGRKIGVVAEGTAQRATMSRSTGVRDAKAALAAANGLGVPKAVPIFAAVDFDATPAQVESYLKGWHQVLGKRAGVYAGIRVIDGVASWMPWLWQTAAWSGGKLSGHAHLYQRVTPQGNMPAGCDENVACRPIPLWGGTVAPPGQHPKPASKPMPAPAQTPAPAPAPPRPFHEQAAIDETRTVIRNAAKAGHKPRATQFRKALNWLLGRKQA